MPHARAWPLWEGDGAAALLPESRAGKAGAAALGGLAAAGAAAAAAWGAFRVARAVRGRAHMRTLEATPYSVEAPTQARTRDGADLDVGARARVAPCGLVRAEEAVLALGSPLMGADAPPHERTVFHLLERVARLYPDAACHGTINPDTLEFEWATYAQVVEDAVLLGLGMDAHGLFTEVPATTFPHVPNLRAVGIFGSNSAAWVRGEYAVLSRAGTTVPLYATLTADSVTYVLNLTGIAAVICTQPETAKRCLQAKPSAPTLRALVLSFSPDAELAELAAAAGVELVTFAALRAEGAAARARLPSRPPTPDTMFTFCFTSGSTGPPKGALITHRAQLTNAAVSCHRIRPAFGELGTTVYLSFLPLAHQMDRTTVVMIHAQAGRVGFSRGKPELIMADTALLRPTLFVAVPRLFARIVQVIEGSALKAGGLKAALFKYAVSVKLQDYADYGALTHPVWDRLVFGKIRAKLGLDRARAILTGSAPMQAAALDYLSVVLSLPFSNGFGQTENVCGLAIEDPLLVRGGEGSRPAHAGGPLVSFEVKLAPVTEMEYLPTDRSHKGVEVVGRGEVCCRGPSLMVGYFAMEDKTKQTVDSEGWLHTGDVGAWLPNGQLIIIDRVSNVFKLSQGEFINLDRTERGVLSCPLLAAAFAFGTTLNSKLVCVAVVNREAVEAAWAAEAKQPPAGAPRTKEAEADFIRERVLKACRAFGLAGYEIPGAYTFLDTPFSMESGVLTPTFKIVRGVAKKVFKEDILRMYKELGEGVEV